MRELNPADYQMLLDLFRTPPDPFADQWDWLVHAARDVGLQRGDLAGLSFIEAALLVRQAEDHWHYGQAFRLHELTHRDLPFVHEADVRAALVSRLDLPVFANFLPSGQLLELAQQHYRISPRTFLLERTSSFEIVIENSIGRLTYHLEAHETAN